MSRHKYFVLFFTFLSYVGCSQTPLEFAINRVIDFSVDTINHQQLETIIESGQSFYLLDTREPHEFEISHLEGAEFVGYKKFDKKSVRDIPQDALVVTYCAVGYRSEKIAEKLKKMGFSNVYNLYGGIFEWKNAGNEVVNQFEGPTDSVHTYNRKWSIFLEDGVKVYD